MGSVNAVSSSIQTIMGDTFDYMAKIHPTQSYSDSWLNHIPVLNSCWCLVAIGLRPHCSAAACDSSQCPLDWFESEWLPIYRVRSISLLSTKWRRNIGRVSIFLYSFSMHIAMDTLNSTVKYDAWRILPEDSQQPWGNCLAPLVIHALRLCTWTQAAPTYFPPTSPPKWRHMSYSVELLRIIQRNSSNMLLISICVPWTRYLKVKVENCLCNNRSLNSNHIPNNHFFFFLLLRSCLWWRCTLDYRHDRVSVSPQCVYANWNHQTQALHSPHISIVYYMCLSILTNTQCHSHMLLTV